jgi:hypothetical protein
MILITRCCNTRVYVERESFLFCDYMSGIRSQSVFVRLPHISFERLVNSNMRNVFVFIILVM